VSRLDKRPRCSWPRGFLRMWRSISWLQRVIGRGSCRIFKRFIGLALGRVPRPVRWATQSRWGRTCAGSTLLRSRHCCHGWTLFLCYVDGAPSACVESCATWMRCSLGATWVLEAGSVAVGQQAGSAEAVSASEQVAPARLNFARWSWGCTCGVANPVPEGGPHGLTLKPLTCTFVPRQDSNLHLTE
jgi:hypothetical protein